MPIRSAAARPAALVFVVVLALCLVFAVLRLISVVRAWGEQSRAMPPTRTSGEPEGLRVARAQCARCHRLPEPSQLPRETWPTVLRWMGNYLGHPDPGPDGQLSGLIAPELVPPTPLVSARDLQSLKDYYLDAAPTQSELEATIRKPATSPLELFDVVAPTVDASMVSLVRIDPQRHLAYVGSTRPSIALTAFDPSWSQRWRLPLPSHPVNIELGPRGFQLDLIGDIRPPDLHHGAIFDVDLAGAAPAVKPLVEDYQRLVAHRVADLDGDGRPDLVLAAFGDLAVGRVAIRWARADGGFDEQALITRSGAVGVEVRDIDGDGRPDLLVAMAQGRNELLLFLNRGGRQFECRQLMEWSSSFGLNGMLLADLDGDGHEEIVVVNGNNLELADPPLRPYHGLHVLQWRGERLEERWSYPMHGAIRACAADLDGDGDLDLVACAFVPDWTSENPETFVWLEQTAPWTFRPHVLDAAHLGRWIAMDVGDLDGDGRPDIILGGGSAASGVPPAALPDYERKMKDVPTVLFLRNHGRPGRR